MTIENPPAFPLGVPHMTDYQPEWGMTLRDWFAGQVIASAAALPLGASDYAHRAQIAYAQAGHLLAARLSAHSVGGEP